MDLTSSVHLSCVRPLQQSSPGKQPCSRSLTPAHAALHSPAGRAVPENLSGQKTSPVPCGLRASSTPGCSSQHLLGSQHSHTLSATDGLLSPARAASMAPYVAGTPPPVNPDSCDGMDRCLIASHMAVMYQATSEHPSNDDGRKTNRRQSRLQLSPAGLYGKGTSPMSFIKLKLHLDPFGT